MINPKTLTSDISAIPWPLIISIPSNNPIPSPKTEEVEHLSSASQTHPKIKIINPIQNQEVEEPFIFNGNKNEFYSFVMPSNVKQCQENVPILSVSKWKSWRSTWPSVGKVDHVNTPIAYRPRPYWRIIVDALERKHQRWESRVSFASLSEIPFTMRKLHVFHAVVWIAFCLTLVKSRLNRIFQNGLNNIKLVYLIFILWCSLYWYLFITI